MTRQRQAKWLYAAMNESARRLQLARQHHPSKYVLEHILRPSQLNRGGGMDLIFAIQANAREFFVSQLDAVASRRSAYNVAQDHHDRLS
jgi:hypothetical protein